MRQYFKVIIKIAVLFSLLITMPAPILSAESSPPYAIRTLPSKVEEAWQAYRLMGARSEREEAAKIRDQILLSSRLDGIRRFDLLGAVLIREGEAALRQGEAAEAIEKGREALIWSPQDPNVRFFLSRALLKQSPFMPHRAATEYFKAIYSSTQDFWHSFYLMGRLILISISGILGGFLIFYVFLLVRFLPLWVHGVRERGILGGPGAWTVLFSLILLPAILGAGPVLVVVISMALLWPMMPLSQRRVAAAFVIFISGVNLWLPPMLSWIKADQSSEIRLLSQVSEGWAEASGTARVLEARGGYDRDWAILFALGLQHRREGNLKEAIEFYRKAQAVAPGESIVHNNLGNVLFLMKDYDQAVAAYKRSIEKDRLNAITYYNLNVIYRELLRFEDAKQAYEEAQKINFSLTASYAMEGQKIIDAVFPRSLLWKRIFSRTSLYATEAAAAHDRWLYPFSMNTLPFLLVIFPMGVVIAAFFVPSKYAATPCAMCGEAVCLHCQRRILDFRVCSACWSEAKNIRRKQDLRGLKFRQRRLSRIARWISIPIPGAGHLVLQEALRGMLFLSLFLALVFVMVGHEWLLRAPGETGRTPGSGRIVLSFLGMIGLYLIVFYDLMKKTSTRAQ